MSAFLENARSIFETATLAEHPSDLTILVGPQGIRMLAESDWPLESLLTHHGVEMAYRISERRGAIRLEGRSYGQSCRLETRSALAARELLGPGHLPCRPMRYLPA